MPVRKPTAKKTLKELIRLREGGFSRIHVRMEKRLRSSLEVYPERDAPRTGGRGLKVRGGGISLCEYSHARSGGKPVVHRAAVETARVLNQINPDHIRLRTPSGG